MMNFRIVSPAAIIDLNRIPDLAYIRIESGVVRIGAMTRQRTVEFSPIVAEQLPLLAEAVKHIAHLPIRSRGTIGGSIAHADPAAELPMVLQALEGEVVARGPAGERLIKAADLFKGLLATSLADDELIVEVRLALMPGRAGFAFKSCMSATSRIISSSRSRFVFAFAETGTMTVSPPQSSASSPRSASCCFTRSGWASPLSILLIATMIGTPAALA